MRFIVLFAVLALTACAPMYSTSYRLTAPQTEEGRMCANQCLDKQSACFDSCRTEEKECRQIKSVEAYAAYMLYVARQERENLPLDKTKADFEDYSACEDDDCADRCESSHQQCHINCGGQLVEETECVAFCGD